MLLLAALLVSWVASTWIGLRHAGWTEHPPLCGCPASRIAGNLALGRNTSLWVAVCAALIGVAVVAQSLTPFWLALPISVAAMAIVGPLPFFLIDALRRDARLQSRQIIFYNPFPESGTTFVRTVEKGEVKDSSQPICLYMDSEDWNSIGVAEAKHRRFFDQHYKIAPGLYAAEGSNEFLHLFDSLALWKFVVHPGNAKAIEAFARALLHAAPPSTPGPAPSAPGSSPSKPPGRRTTPASTSPSPTHSAARPLTAAPAPTPSPAEDEEPIRLDSTPSFSSGPSHPTATPTPERPLPTTEPDSVSAPVTSPSTDASTTAPKDLDDWTDSDALDPLAPHDNTADSVHTTDIPTEAPETTAPSLQPHDVEAATSSEVSSEPPKTERQAPAQRRVVPRKTPTLRKPKASTPPVLGLPPTDDE